MIITCNGQRIHTDQPISVAQLLDQYGYSHFGIAVACNQTVLPRAYWDRPLADGDSIDIVTAVQGG